MFDQQQRAILHAWDHRTDAAAIEAATPAVGAVIRALGLGQLRVADPPATPEGSWSVNEWVKKAILLHFRQSPMRRIEAGELAFWDKVDVVHDWETRGVRVVPGAVVREGAHIEPGAILMPCFVNIGARVGAGTMIDTWSTVGSCAQIGRDCHISGGVGIGGVLEPPQAAPVVIEDNVFIGARSEVAEGVRVREGCVLAMGCYLGASTRIFNAMTGKVIEGELPPRSVVVPGALPSRDGSHQTYALIIKKWRDDKTDARTALNDVLRG